MLGRQAIVNGEDDNLGSPHNLSQSPVVALHNTQQEAAAMHVYQGVTGLVRAAVTWSVHADPYTIKNLIGDGDLRIVSKVRLQGLLYVSQGVPVNKASFLYSKSLAHLKEKHGS